VEDKAWLLIDNLGRSEPAADTRVRQMLLPFIRRYITSYYCDTKAETAVSAPAVLQQGKHCSAVTRKILKNCRNGNTNNTVL
jgi:hypothetical protein